tara:strand:- start:33 stop:659 length:627 start_codon:yes stop_codon:yes gene_type:complete
MKDMEDVNVNDVLYAVNKYIKYKTSARKSYIRTKILKKDDKCDITQLCYALYNATENKTVVVNDNQENMRIQRQNLQLEKKVNEYEYTINELEQSIKTLKISNSSLREINSDNEDYKKHIEELKIKLNEKKQVVFKPIVDNSDKLEIEELKRINERLVKRIHNGDFDNPSDKDIIIRNLKEDIENMKQQHNMERMVDEENMLNDLNKI